MKTETQLLANNNRPEQSNAQKTKIDKIIVNYRITDVFIQVDFWRPVLQLLSLFSFQNLKISFFCHCKYTVEFPSLGFQIIHVSLLRSHLVELGQS